jgi:hypothetical protein
MGPIGCLETSVRSYHHSLRNSPEEGSSQLLRGGSQQSRIVAAVCPYAEVSMISALSKYVCYVGNVCKASFEMLLVSPWRI